LAKVLKVIFYLLKIEFVFNFQKIEVVFLFPQN
jgi:hypothetical protein